MNCVDICMYYDPLSSKPITVNHGDCIGTFINIAYSFQQSYTSSEWLNIKKIKKNLERSLNFNV